MLAAVTSARIAARFVLPPSRTDPSAVGEDEPTRHARNKKGPCAYSPSPPAATAFE